MNRLIYLAFILPMLIFAQEEPQKKEQKELMAAPTTKEERALVRKGNDLFAKKTITIYLTQCLAIVLS